MRRTNPSPFGVAVAAATALLDLSLLPALAASTDGNSLIGSAGNSLDSFHEAKLVLPVAGAAESPLVPSAHSFAPPLGRRRASTALLALLTQTAGLLLSVSAVIFLTVSCARYRGDSLRFFSSWGVRRRSLAAGDSPCNPSGDAEDRGTPEKPGGGEGTEASGAEIATATGATAAGSAAVARRQSPLEMQQQILGIGKNDMVGLTEEEVALIAKGRRKLEELVEDMRAHQTRLAEARRAMHAAERGVEDLLEVMERMHVDESAMGAAVARRSSMQEEFERAERIAKNFDASVRGKLWDTAQDITSLALYASSYERRHMQPAAARALVAAERVLGQSVPRTEPLNPTELDRTTQMVNWYIRLLDIERVRQQQQGDPRNPESGALELIRDSRAFAVLLNNAGLPAEGLRVGNAADAVHQALFSTDVHTHREETVTSVKPKATKSVRFASLQSPRMAGRFRSVRSSRRPEQGAFIVKPLVRQTIQFAGDPTEQIFGLHQRIHGGTAAPPAAGSAHSGVAAPQLAPTAASAVTKAEPAAAAPPRPAPTPAAAAADAVTRKAALAAEAQAAPQAAPQGGVQPPTLPVRASRSSKDSSTGPVVAEAAAAVEAPGGAAALVVDEEGVSREQAVQQVLDQLEDMMKKINTQLVKSWQELLSASLKTSDLENWPQTEDVLRRTAKIVGDAGKIRVHRAVRTSTKTAFRDCLKKCEEAGVALMDSVDSVWGDHIEAEEESIRKMATELTAAAQLPAPSVVPDTVDMLLFSITQLNMELGRVGAYASNIESIVSAFQHSPRRVTANLSSLSRSVTEAVEQMKNAGGVCAQRWISWVEGQWKMFENAPPSRGPKAEWEEKRRQTFKEVIIKAEEVAYTLEKVVGNLFSVMSLKEVLKQGKAKLDTPDKTQEEEGEQQ